MEVINPMQRLSEGNGGPTHSAQFAPAIHPHLTVELLKYLKILSLHARLIVGLTIAMMALSVLYNEFLATKLYQAQATITPVPPDQDVSQIGGVGLGDVLGGAGAGLESMLMGSSDNELVSERDIAILNSFDFTNSLVKRYNLAEYLFAGEGGNAKQVTPWRNYQRINGSFATSYDYKSGNLDLTFIDSSRERARQVLAWYLEALRERLRTQEVQSSAVAAKSLEDEIAHTSDSLLQAQLYELLARQIQREKLAQVEADFAFKIIEPPVVPDARYSPQVTRIGLLTGLFVLLVTSLTIVIWQWVAHAHEHLRASTGSLVPLVDSLDNEEPRPREPGPPERIRLQR